LCDNGYLALFVDVQNGAFFVIAAPGKSFADDGLDIIQIEPQVNRKYADGLIGKCIVCFHYIKGIAPTGLDGLIHLELTPSVRGDHSSGMCYFMVECQAKIEGGKG
jgi:hypothetical protein